VLDPGVGEGEGGREGGIDRGREGFTSATQVIEWAMLDARCSIPHTPEKMPCSKGMSYVSLTIAYNKNLASARFYSG
jgi:hypothetical protein